MNKHTLIAGALLGIVWSFVGSTPADASTTSPVYYRVLSGQHSPLLPDAHRCKVPRGAYADDQWCLRIGPWSRVGQPLADALAEGGSPHATTRNWQRCYKNRMPGVGIAIACPSGYIEVA